MVALPLENVHSGGRSRRRKHRGPTQSWSHDLSFSYPLGPLVKRPNEGEVPLEEFTQLRPRFLSANPMLGKERSPRYLCVLRNRMPTPQLAKVGAERIAIYTPDVFSLSQASPRDLRDSITGWAVGVRRAQTTKCPGLRMTAWILRVPRIKSCHTSLRYI